MNQEQEVIITAETWGFLQWPYTFDSLPANFKDEMSIQSLTEDQEEEGAETLHGERFNSAFSEVSSETRPFQRVKLFKMVNRRGMVVMITTLGARITSIIVPDKQRRLNDIVLGFDNLHGYMEYQKFYFNCIIGRVANRIANACFQMDDRIYDISMNAQPDSLHGGVRGFDQVVWRSHIEGEKLILSHLSHHGDQGYPGNLLIQICYKLKCDNTLCIDIVAKCDKPTPIDIAKNIYFNLAGHNGGMLGLEQHILTLNSDKYILMTEEQNPTGKLKTVGGSILDLRIPRQMEKQMYLIPGGFDHIFCINRGPDDNLRFVARLVHPPSGRVVEMFSNQPCAYLCTGKNFPVNKNLECGGNCADDFIDDFKLDEKHMEDEEEYEEQIYSPGEIPFICGKQGAQYNQYAGVTIMTSNFPNAVNEYRFPGNLLKPGECYRHSIRYRFGIVRKGPHGKRLFNDDDEDDEEEKEKLCPTK